MGILRGPCGGIALLQKDASVEAANYLLEKTGLGGFCVFLFFFFLLNHCAWVFS